MIYYKRTAVFSFSKHIIHGSWLMVIIVIIILLASRVKEEEEEISMELGLGLNHYFQKGGITRLLFIHIVSVKLCI